MKCKIIGKMKFAIPLVLVCLAVSVIVSSYAIKIRKMEFEITNQWDSTPITHPPIKIQLSWHYDDDFLTAVFEGPFFNDPKGPDAPPGKPFPGLWNYEVAEIFFLSPNDDKYLEVEVCPHGQHLLLLLNGTRHMIKDELPMDYTASIDSITSTWKGTAKIPLGYLPHNVGKLNAYAIHGSGDNRIYEALYPVEKGKFSQPDFHRLKYFKPFDIKKIVGDLSQIGTYWDKL